MPRALGLILYREYQDGATIDELSEALELPPSWIRERIEAVRMCLERQVRVELRPMPRRRPAPIQLNTESERTRRTQ